VPADRPTAAARRRTASPTSAPDAAFELHVLPEMEVLLRVATSITRDPVDAEDLVQETVLRAYRAIERFDGRYPRAWLLTIMRNAQINRVRRKRPELMRDPDATMARMADDGEGGESAEALVVGPTFDAVVEQAYRSLPEKFRLVVELVDLNGLAYREAADLLDLPVGTVMSRLHRARNRMRDQLTAADLAPRRRHR
jgi:RNA polymerase sigma-70 factor (ECF subfamily)